MISSYIRPVPISSLSHSDSLTSIDSDSLALWSHYTLLDHACSTGLAQLLIVLFVLFWLFVPTANEAFFETEMKEWAFGRWSFKKGWYRLESIDTRAK